jgi:4-hydroxy-tetrahydrodipicolinate synthase
MANSMKHRCAGWCGTTRTARSTDWCISDLTELLFAEPSPAPAKYWLWRTGLIDSVEVRPPIVEVSAPLAARLDAEIDRRLPVIAGSGRVAR